MKIQNDIKRPFKELHEKVDIYSKKQTVSNSEAAYMDNRKAIVYLYLARFGYLQIVSQKELKKFRADINHAVYYNDFLQHSDAMKISQEERSWLTKYSDSEHRRLQLLQAITDNDIQQAQVLLKIAVIEAIPDIKFLAETR